MPTYSIVQFGWHDSFVLEIDGQMSVTHSSPIYVAAYLEAIMRGAEQRDAQLIAQTIYKRPDPTLAEREVHFSVTGPWRPAPSPYKSGKP